MSVILVLWKQRQEDRCKLEASQISIGQPARTPQQVLVSRKNGSGMCNLVVKSTHLARTLNLVYNPGDDVLCLSVTWRQP